MAEEAAPPGQKRLRQAIRWAGGVLVAASLLFIARHLWLLNWTSLAQLASWRLFATTIASAALFLLANFLLARAWVRLADPGRQVEVAQLVPIYGRSVLLKYLPGSVFQYLGRHAEAADLGLSNTALARSHGLEIALHLVASLAVAAACLTFVGLPVAAASAAVVVVMACVAIARPLTTALLFQLVAFTAFATAAALIGLAVLPAGTNPAQFAALFLLAWMIGFLVPLAPGGLGVREAALLALAGASLPAANVLAALLVLRLASVAGDLTYGLGAMRGAWRQTV
ncbi:MAG: hypothetical protein JY451_00105 [Erythrobacter sp.]|nr:MAG: hypothetical protein JY451_00105 [Erythrobacter sp.]